MRTLALVLLVVLAWPRVARGDTLVVSYVDRVQDEREQERFTLTEWLRIKERMKMMDLWLAMFSDPKEDAHFQPELSLNYGLTEASGTPDSSANLTSGMVSHYGRAQFFLTNFFSWSTKKSLLNVDVGIEGYARQGNRPLAASSQSSTAFGAVATPIGKSQPLTRFYGGDFRLFGRDIQDSSLVLKIGSYDSTWAPAPDGNALHGLAAGAELQLYVFKWLGLNGNLLNYGDSRTPGTGGAYHGTYLDYQAYIEVSLLRFGVGFYRESWSTRPDSVEKGRLGSVSMEF